MISYVILLVFVVLTISIFRDKNLDFKNKIILFIGLFALIPFLCLNKNSFEFKGVLVDPKTESVIIDASVWVEGQSQSLTKSDSTGFLFTVKSSIPYLTWLAPLCTNCTSETKIGVMYDNKKCIYTIKTPKASTSGYGVNQFYFPGKIDCNCETLKR
jgi:hypothetical protein